MTSRIDEIKERLDNQSAELNIFVLNANDDIAYLLKEVERLEGFKKLLEITNDTQLMASAKISKLQSKLEKCEKVVEAAGELSKHLYTNTDPLSTIHIAYYNNLQQAIAELEGGEKKE